jgi:YHS domain-containing protein
MGVSDANANSLQRDPVCGRRLEHQWDHLSAEYKKRRYYFCSEACKLAFRQQTERFRMGELARAGALFSRGKVRWGLG